jgi:hypothetical protein
MMKRTLVLALAVVAAQSGAAFADNNWSFDDPYWKRPAASGAMTSYAASGGAVDAQFAKYQQVDGFNY